MSQDALLSKCRQAPHHHQKMELYALYRITNILRKIRSEIFTKKSCMDQGQSPTICAQTVHVFVLVYSYEASIT
jgi:hypothetical protein